MFRPWLRPEHRLYKCALPAPVERLEWPFYFGVGRHFRRHSYELAIAILYRRAFQLFVLALFVELNAGAGTDIIGDVGLADGIGERLRVGRTGALVGIGSDEQ